MKTEQKQIAYFDKETPLPMHMLLIEEMPKSKFSPRLCESSIARTKEYLCVRFYKPISRPLPLERRERYYDRSR